MVHSNAMTPVPLSVIVVCRNPGVRIRAALESVWTQRGVAVDLVVIDGASTDGTREWLEQQRSRLGTLISEPDNGVYSAMNKGIAAARGEWVLFLGADDALANEIVLSEMLGAFRDTTSAVVVGDAQYRDGRTYRLAASPRPIARNFIHHQAAFYRRSVLEENGRFDETLAVMADYDFNLRIWKAHVRFKPVPFRVAHCGAGGLSDRGDWRGYREEIAVRHRHFAAWRCWLWDAISVVRFIRKRIIRLFSTHG
jgi:glycosyltransferase involved in cell wall biosynthesis